MQSVTIFALIALCLATSSLAVPVAIFEVPVQEVAVEGGNIASVPVTLLDVDSADQSGVDSESESQRTARGLGLLTGKFGGLGLGHSFKGFGGFGGFGGLGSFHGFGGGLHGLGGGFKPFFGKPFFG